MAVRVVTDSTSDLTPEAAAEVGVTVVPALVVFGGESLRDRVDVDPAAFYERLVSSREFPTTSQPPVEAFAAAYREIAAEGLDIASIHVSSRLSGTLNSASVASETNDLGVRVELVDSYTVGAALRAAVLAAARRARDGGTLEEVTAAARGAMARSQVVVALDTLEYLRKGGRIGRASALLGSALRLKPLIHIDGGEVAPFDRVRTRARALARLEQVALDDPTIESLCAIWSDDESGAAGLIERVRPHLPHTRLETLQLGPAIGAHVGPNATGVCTVRREA